MSTSADIHIREASANDMDGVFHVRTSVVENHLTEEALAGYGITRESLVDAMNAGAMKIWCAECGGNVVGFSVAEPESREISALFVLPNFEGRGAGGRLLDVAVEWLKARNDGPIRLYTDPSYGAYGFYERRGWVDLKQGPPDRPDSTDTCMELRQ